MANELRIYFGKGEYRLTNENLPKLSARLADFQATGRWTWNLQDCLGIAREGKKNRFHQIMATKTEEPEFQALQTQMAEFVYPAEITHPTARMGQPVVKMVSEEAKAVLETLTDEQKKALGF